LLSSFSLRRSGAVAIPIFSPCFVFPCTVKVDFPVDPVSSLPPAVISESAFAYFFTPRRRRRDLALPPLCRDYNLRPLGCIAVAFQGRAWTHPDWPLRSPPPDFPIKTPRLGPHQPFDADIRFNPPPASLAFSLLYELLCPFSFKTPSWSTVLVRPLRLSPIATYGYNGVFFFIGCFPLFRSASVSPRLPPNIPRCVLFPFTPPLIYIVPSSHASV